MTHGDTLQMSIWNRLQKLHNTHRNTLVTRVTQVRSQRVSQFSFWPRAKSRIIGTDRKINCFDILTKIGPLSLDFKRFKTVVTFFKS